MIHKMMDMINNKNLYCSPTSRVLDVDVDLNFLASGDFGQGGYPGKDLEPGDEFDF